MIISVINDNIVRTITTTNAACLFLCLQQSLRTKSSIVANYQFKSRTRTRTFNLAAIAYLKHGLMSYERFDLLYIV